MIDFVEYVKIVGPNLVGFAILAYVLWHMNNKLLDAVLKRLDKLEAQVEAIIVANMKQ